MTPPRKQRISVVLCGMVLSALWLFSLRASAAFEDLSDMDCVIEPSLTVELGAKVPGLLANSYFDRSDFVNAGTVVASLESDVERVALAIAKQLASSTTAVEVRRVTERYGARTQERNKKMLKTSGISRQVMDQVTTEARIAELQVLQEEEGHRLAILEVLRAEAMLERRDIVSPISGTVVRRYKTVGEYVDSDPVYQIAQLDPLKVEVIVPVEYLGRIKSGMNAGISIDIPGFDESVLQAKVRRIDSVADAASGTYGVRLTLDNPGLIIPSGIRCQADFLGS